MALIKKLNEIAEAIGEKTGHPAETYTVDNMPDGIRSIQTAFPGPDPLKTDEDIVRFIDFDGTVLHSMTLSQAKAMTSLPELPKHKYLVPVGWSETLAYIKGSPRAVDVGALYNVEMNEETGTRPTIILINPNAADVQIQFYQSVENGVLIDWGDGSKVETVAGTGLVTVNHTWDVDVTRELPLVMKLTPKSTEIELHVGGASNTAKFFPKQTSSSNSVVGNMDIYFGDATIETNAFDYCIGLCNFVSSHDATKWAPSASQYMFSYCHGLRCVILPKHLAESLSLLSTTQSVYCFAYCSGLSTVVIPSWTVNLPCCFYRCAMPYYLVLPDSLTGVYYTFYGESSSAAKSRVSKIVMGDNVGAARHDCFLQYNNFDKIRIPSSWTSFSDAFGDCGLSVLEIPETMDMETDSEAKFPHQMQVREIIIPDICGAPTGREWISSAPAVEKVQFSVKGRNKNQYVGAVGRNSTLKKIIVRNADSSTFINHYYEGQNDQWRAFFPKYNATQVLDFRTATGVPQIVKTSYSGDDSIFTYMPPFCKIVVPDDLYDEWKSAQYWSYAAKNIVKASDYHDDEE